MTTKNRVQLSLRFDNHAELLAQAKAFCRRKRISLTELIAQGLQLAMATYPVEPVETSPDKIAEIEERLSRLESLVIPNPPPVKIPNKKLAMVAEDLDENVTAEDLGTSELLVEDNGEELIPNPRKDVQEDLVSTQKLSAEIVGDVLGNSAAGNGEDEIPNPPVDVQEDLVSIQNPPAVNGLKLTPSQLRSKANSIAKTLWDSGYRISRGVIKEVILDMYPEQEAWATADARREVIKALKKRYAR